MNKKATASLILFAMLFASVSSVKAEDLKPDLKILDFTPEFTNSTSITGGSIKEAIFRIKVKNDSQTRVSGPFYVSIEASPTAEYPNGYWGLGKIDKWLASGEEYTTSISQVFVLPDVNMTPKINVTAKVDKICFDRKDCNDILESNEENNFLTKELVMPVDISALTVETDSKYNTLDTSQQDIKLIIRDINGQAQSGRYVYYQTDEALKRGESYKDQQYEKNADGNWVAVNTDYFGRMGSQTEGGLTHYRFRTKLSNTKFHYIITNAYYKEITPNDSSKILKTGELTTQESYKQTPGDLEIINNSFAIDYLQGDDYINTRKVAFAKIGFKYFNDIKADIANRKVNRNIIKNLTTNKTINLDTSVYGLYRYESEADVFLTKEQYGNFFVNGVNNIECLLDTTKVFAEKNEANNGFSQSVTLSNVVEVPDSVVNVDGLVASPGMRVVDSSGNTITNKPTTQQNTNSNSTSTQINKELELKKTPEKQFSIVSPIKQGMERIEIKSEQKIIIDSGKNLNAITDHTNKPKNTKAQEKTLKKYTEPLVKGDIKITTPQKYAINNFIVYGTQSTRKISQDARIVAVKKFKAQFKKLPKSENDWKEVLKITKVTK